MPAKNEILNRTLGSPFADLDRLQQAITHRSYGSTNNERLEFLGDAILDLAIAEHLCQRFPSATEGQLSRFRAHLVRRETLASLARDFDLGSFLLLGEGEKRSGGFDRDSILADALEAIIGALYLETDYTTVRDKIVGWFDGRLGALSLDDTQKDAKTALQEYLQAQRSALPEYVVTSESGLAHARTFIVQCHIPLLSKSVLGYGTSRRMAEQEAAEQALILLGVTGSEER